ncbi:hypothetical protein TNCT6_54930 [Streptomyces sp. 6-11-2]|nr:hypothetical protein TNCT6_54930 [Streptomyces sp. 6-11-2]
MVVGLPGGEGDRAACGRVAEGVGHQVAHDLAYPDRVGFHLNAVGRLMEQGDARRLGLCSVCRGDVGEEFAGRQEFAVQLQRAGVGCGEVLEVVDGPVPGSSWR